MKAWTFLEIPKWNCYWVPVPNTSTDSGNWKYLSSTVTISPIYSSTPRRLFTYKGKNLRWSQTANQRIWAWILNSCTGQWHNRQCIFHLVTDPLLLILVGRKITGKKKWKKYFSLHSQMKNCTYAQTWCSVKAAVWSFQKKVDLARGFEWAQLPAPSFFLSAALQPCLQSPSPTEEPAVHEQARNHCESGRLITKTAHSK